jgi:hypothetical protein
MKAQASEQHLNPHHTKAIKITVAALSTSAIVPLTSVMAKDVHFTDIHCTRILILSHNKPLE